ncbi:PRP1 splicing factor, N-terminal-domain-containing protein [Neocallimastix lanati (nom. inval.)]|jgi:pre-mRNA-processing factor 6|uniref:PRP1 splicing factor N-terminal domain-containing protein n=1 Tax=Neocallimastix californiae TaxID=1754190 RepID=A0A1Y2FSG5_9FUNG|nr:PRP1 splicing factor, N-terminal-domain-containing protein [Neocallimastix sp. JGI-2020a]ORY86527.1 hypothetical protein LY90DRAFT_696832 [Neocallimastix californiae]|eukprot:ORY86527.1 hypothetical protein LY90DRAFT_696832 [Neocallimastix californiae]
MWQFQSSVVKDFMQRQPPPNYVAGLGRGATGFTTRSDIGPARESSEITPAQAEKFKDEQNEEDDGDNQDLDNETGLFSTAPYEADDEEADQIYGEIDKKMDERRKKRREERERQELLKFRAERPKIQQQFADLKRGLSVITDEEWNNIPEVGDLVRKKSRKSAAQNNMRERYTPVPDSVLRSATQSTEYVSQLDSRQQLYGGLTTPADTTTDFEQFGRARDKVLGIKLDQISDSVTGQTTIDPKGYLTDLNSIVVKSDAEISDMKKARMLLKSVITTNPKNAPGWIAAARLEEFAGKIVAARDIIAKGCEECPKSEDVWLEAARLNNVDNAKIILANAVKHIPQSVRLWLRAMSLETDVRNKKRVIRRSLEFIPNSVKLWKTAISMEEDPNDAKILLSRAVECVPLSVELWLAFARLEKDYHNAKIILNKAGRLLPTSFELYIAAARLEEEQGNEERLDKIIKNSYKKFSISSNILDREQWLKEAEKCEQEEHVSTCQAIIRNTIGLGLEEEDKKATWMEDAESCIAHGTYETARAIYAYALKEFPNKKSIWRRAAFLEKAHGTREQLEELLQKAVKHCPQAEVLWLMGAKEKWLAGDIDGARGILEEAFRANPNSEQIWLAAIKLESENGEHSRARILLENARESASTERVWMKSVVLERQLKNYDAALELLKTAVVKYPKFDKLWMIYGQIYQDDLKDLSEARQYYNKGLKNCPKSIPLWLLASRLEEQAGLLIKARATLEKGRLLNPKIPELWCEAVRVENRGGNTSMAKALIAKALQECPSSGLLWSEAILMEPRPQRKSRSTDALKKTDNHPQVIVTVARLFWAERKVDKARNWFNRAVKTDADIGDHWAWYLKFEMQHGDSPKQLNVIKRCVEAEPHHGELWCKVSKSMANVGKTTEQILLEVTSQISNTL